MEFITVALILALLVVYRTAIKKALFRMRHFRAVKDHTDKIVKWLHINHPEFFDKNNWSMIHDADIQLEFRLLPLYEELFKAHGIVLFESSRNLQGMGFSHGICIHNAVVLVKNFVDVTDISERVA